MEENRVMERNQMTEKNQPLWLGGLSRFKLSSAQWLWGPFTGPSKSWSCPHPGICHCLDAFSHRCILKYPLAKWGVLYPHLPPSFARQTWRTPRMWRVADGWDWGLRAVGCVKWCERTRGQICSR